MSIDRRVLAERMLSRIEAQAHELKRQWTQTSPINYFVVDDLLPEEWVSDIRRSFPKRETMTLKKSLRELKYVTAQMNQYEPILEEIVYAFQESAIVDAISRITELKCLEPDPLLYAGGLSLMAPGHFLNPHVDNSHDKFRKRYRVLNLLYYVSPQWTEKCGANLELWPCGPLRSAVTILSKFNRLVVMVTHSGSWHSVSTNVSKQDRCCVSNYYFSSLPVGGSDYFHVTSFRGRPEQPIRDWILRGDIWLRMMTRKIFPNGIRDNPHFYKSKERK